MRNFIARGNLKKMKQRDEALFYHTGKEKQMVGIVEVVREAYPDPTDEKKIFVAVTVKAVKPLPQPVTLATVKGDARPPLGAAGHAGAMEDRLRDGRDVAYRMGKGAGATSMPGAQSRCAFAHPTRFFRSQPGR